MCFNQCLLVQIPTRRNSVFLTKNAVISERIWIPHLYKQYPNNPQYFKRKLYFQNSAASFKRWIYLLSTAITGLVTAAVLLKRGLQTLKNFTDVSLPSLWKLGFGQVDPLTQIAAYLRSSGESLGALGSPSVILLLANLPQLLVSLLHLNYNGLFTCMLMEKEWNDFAYDRKGLRVSSPSEGQK